MFNLAMGTLTAGIKPLYVSGFICVSTPRADRCVRIANVDIHIMRSSVGTVTYAPGIRACGILLMARLRMADLSADVSTDPSALTLIFRLFRSSVRKRWLRS